MAKPLTIRCRDADHPDGGYAAITIANLADYRGDGQLIVRRFDRPEQFLGRHGWQVAEATLRPRDMQTTGGQLILTVGPEMVDYMETGLSVQIQMVEGGQAGALVWPEVASSILRGSDRRNIAGRQVVAGDPLSRQQRDAAGRRAPAPEAPQPAPPPGPAPPPEQRLGSAHGGSASAPFHDAKTIVVPGPKIPKPSEDPPTVRPGTGRANVLGDQTTGKKASGGSGVLAAMLIGIGAALALAGGAWVYITCPSWAPICSALPPSPQPADPLADVPPCQAERLIRDASARPLEEVHREAIACQKRGEWSVSIGALQIAVSRGHGPSATAMAALHDPATFKPGGFLAQADPYEAARYFRLAVDLGDTAAAPARETLRQYLVQQAAQGSTAAKLALQNYW